MSVGRIHVLDTLVADMIAAGEVVERPASVVKELIENSIDAGAGKIIIEIVKGGIELIRVTDDGMGIAPEDVPTAFLRHATSKITNAEDLFSIKTMGFRGEALASIAAVSRTEIITKQRIADFGFYLKMQAGEAFDSGEIGSPDGTTMTVRNLFYNVPARMKFLKKDSAEAAAVADTVIHAALGNPSVSFRLISDGKEKLYTPGDGDLKNCIYALYGPEYASELRKVSYSDNGVTVTGFCGNENLSRSTRGYETFFVNGRFFKSRGITYALEQGYQDSIMKGKFPFAVLNISVDPITCDVNVHPAKTEVKFSNERLVTSAVYWGIKNAIYKAEYTVSEESPELPEETAYVKPQTSALFSNEIKFESEFERKEKEKDAPHVMYRKASAPKLTERAFIQEKKQNEPEQIPQPVQQKIISDYKPDLPEFKIIGQVFDTYIIVQSNDEVWLIDQHAAHERMNFERLKAERDSGKALSQALLTPITLSFSHTEHSEILENIDIFRELGFEIDDFGDNSFIIRSAPYVSDKAGVDEVFRELIEIVRVNGAAARGSIESEALYSLACHSAIRANKHLSMTEMQKLVEDVFSIPPTCPHGRPVRIVLSKKEIEKMFKRIV